MTITEILQQKTETASQTIGAVNTFCEYIGSKFNDLANFMSGIGNNASVYLTGTDSVPVQKLCVITQNIYTRSTEEPDTLFNVPYDDMGHTVSVTGEQITSAFNDQLGELKVQEQYLMYCLRSEEIDSTSFMSRVRTIAPNVPGAILDKFGCLMDASGSPIECIKNYLSTVFQNKVTFENQYVTLVNPDDYTGNVWASAWTQVTTTISGFFSDVWQGIENISGLFTRLVGAIVNLGKWAFGKLFGNLMTVYEKASGAVMGIMDLPIYQCVVSEDANPWDLRSSIDVLYGFLTTGYSWDGKRHCWQREGTAAQRSSLAASIHNLTYDVLDGVVYTSVCEVVVPGSSKFDIALRLGRDSSNRIILAAYIVTDYSSWSKYDDMSVKAEVWQAFRAALMHISSVVPMISYEQDVDDTSVHWSETADEFIDYTKTHDNATDLIGCNLHLTDNLARAAYDSDATVADKERARKVLAMLTYMCVMSKGFVAADFNSQTYSNPSTWTDNTDAMLSGYLYGSNCTYTPSDPDDLEVVAEITVPLDLSGFSKITYKPFSKRNQLPATVHYQNTSEQAREILDAFKKIIVAVVVTVATVKIMKWTKQRRKDTLLAHANVDRLSWDVAANPTAANIDAFNKAYSKSRQMDFVNGILGLSSGDGSSLISKAVGSLTSAIGHGNQVGYSETSSAATSITRDVNDKTTQMQNNIARMLFPISVRK